MSVRCQFPTGFQQVCGRAKLAWTATMLPICPLHDRIACPKCHKQVIDGNATTCASCQADVRIKRKDVV